ncbi:MAG TPA: thiamine pyrophosphate-binding protein [Alphaproteobacteria bacterium]|jgi:acetolactate synthase-1/2/3 large subunit|nr:thiamine pyrophosphate-binding protein [Alphaproteobacteria bacterium]MDP6269286.1 thiamine pyrophosphate-binding protein [Alphaproteobacteria bacterium]HJM52017.1 thiamine pyrophosphate-binding protein [Alphaproteobacteria bacterium]
MKIRGGTVLAQALLEKGIDQVFTLSGGFCIPALEGLMECQIPVVNAPHEQIAGHLADGRTRITRKPTACLIGPEGFANAVPAMMEAWGERSPVIFITGSSTFQREGSGGFKEIDDVAIAAPLTKYSAAVRDGTRISEFVDRAYRIATSGYPGPVHLSIPVDIMYSSFEEAARREERPFDRRHRAPARAWPCPDDLEPILDLVASAQRPILIGGHGAWWSGAEAEFEAVGKQLGIPLFNVPYHQKLLGEDNPAYMGLADVHQYPPSKFALQQSDVAIVLGGRLDNQLNFGNPPLFPESTQLVCVNGSQEELDLNRSADRTLLSDPGAFLEALLGLERDGSWKLGTDWYESNRAKRGEWVAETLAELEKPFHESLMHPLQLALDVQGVLGADDWLVVDGGNTHFWSEIAVNVAGWQGQKLRGILHPGTFSLLGVGVSFALSAKLAQPESKVLLISGDGAFLSGGLSVEAAFQENAPITVVIDNNGSLDCIAQQQERIFHSKQRFATDFRDIPFHTMFEGLGGHGELVESREQLQPALQRALASGKTACVNVKTKGIISPVVLAMTDRRDKSSIE